MRSAGSMAAICANGTLTTVAGRAASSPCVTVMVTAAASATGAQTTSATSVARREKDFMYPPPAAAGKIALCRIVAYPAGLWHCDRRVDHCPERPLGKAGSVEQQRSIGASHGEAVEPGVVVGDAPETHRLHARAIECVEQRAVQQRLLREHGLRWIGAVVGLAGRDAGCRITAARVRVDGHVQL